MIEGRLLNFRFAGSAPSTYSLRTNCPMPAEIKTSNAPVLNGGKPIHTARLIFMAGLLGVAVGVLFILVQPLFGMDTLTSRHAALYQQLGGWSATPAVLIAWFAHLTVSVLYGLMSGIVVMTVSRLKLVAMLTLAFAWVTTVIAPPANAIIVQLVAYGHIDGNKLPGLNFNLDEKFVLHLAFFAAISGVLYLYRSNFAQLSPSHELTASQA